MYHCKVQGRIQIGDARGGAETVVISGSHPRPKR